MRHSALLLTAIVLLGACDSADVVEPPLGPEPRFVSADAVANPHNTVSAELVVTATLYDSVFVRFWAAGDPPRESPRYAFGDDSVVAVPILGLDTATTYSLETNLTLGDSITAVEDTTEFTTGTLPPWIPVATPVGTDTTAGFLTLSYPDGAVIINNAGDVVWYRYFPNGVLNSFQAHGNGQYTILGLDDTLNQFHVLDELGVEVGTLACVDRPTRFHEVAIRSGGDAWLLCDETRIMDLSAIGGVDTASVTATVLQHLDADGDLLFEWNAFDHFDITDLDANSRGGPNVNFTHGNGIAFDAAGSVLLSFRSLNEVTKIDAATGDVIWRFGGLRNQFTFLNDSKGSIERIHGLRPAGPGQIQVLDNGNGPPSRLVRFLLNPVAMTALTVIDFRDSPTTFTVVGGNSQYYTNGHGLVSFGRAGRVIEVDEVGNRAWELTGIEGTYVFRAQRIQSLYAPGRGDPTR